MSDAAFRDFQTRQRHAAPARAVNVLAVVLEAPATTADKVRVQAVGETSGHYLGEASWPKPAGKEKPGAGDECLVSIDNRGAPWITGWAIPNWGH
jgi:hypothetical protein